MSIPLDELKARILVYYTPEELVEVLDIEYEVLLDMLEDIVWDQQDQLIMDMGYEEELEEEENDDDST